MAIIDKPSDYFNTKLYVGNGGTQSITGLDFQPDWVWIKNRSSAQNNRLFDSVRGAGFNLVSNATSAQIAAGTGTDGQLRSFTSDGFTVGSDGSVNNNNENIVSWNWKESADAGFDILTYEGSGSAQTISHNLGVKPDMIIVKNIDSSDPPFNWRVYHSSLGAGVALKLNGTDAVSDDPGYWNDTEPTSSVFSVKNSGETNNSGQTYIAYLFAGKQGYSKFGSYTGNGNADGTFVYTGFKPAFIMVKRSNGTENWTIMDNTRDPFNVAGNKLHPNTTGGTDAGATIDILSNGFKNRTTNAGANGSGDSYIYMAIAENPFVTSTDNGSIPATAR